MNMIYNSPNYCVVEFAGGELAPALDVAASGKAGARRLFGGGFEIMDKSGKREIFLQGALAERFRQTVRELIAGEPTVEEIDDFLDRFQGLAQHPLVLH